MYGLELLPFPKHQKTEDKAKMSETNQIPNNIVNTQIDWSAPVELQNGIEVKVSSISKSLARLYGDTFTCVVNKSTGLPVSDLLNWDFFPVKNMGVKTMTAIILTWDKNKDGDVCDVKILSNAAGQSIIFKTDAALNEWFLLDGGEKLLSYCKIIDLDEK